MKSKRPTKFQKFLLFVFAVFIIHRIFFRAPSEAEMIANFQNHKADFEQIRLMLQQDKNVQTVGSGWVQAKYISKKLPNGNEIVSGEEMPLNISDNRIALYNSRLKSLGFSRVDSRDGDIKLIEFGGGFTDTTWSIGYLYSEKTPKPLVKSAYNQRPPRDKRHYSRIEGNWYIYHRR